MMKTNLGFLPSLDEMEISSVKDENLSQKESEKRTYEQFKLDQQQKVGVSKRTESPVITLRMLEIAPENFFDKFNKLVRDVTSKIINSVSAEESTVHIANLRRDPTNQELKENVLFIVMSEFNKIDRVDDEIKLLNPVDKDIVLAMVINEVIGLGPLEPLWNEKKVTEIIANGPHDIQIEVSGTIRRIPSVKFRDKNHLKSLIDKLYGSINKQLSPVNPTERGRLHDNSRMYAVHEVIAPKGPNFNIRKHAEKYWTPLDIVRQGTASKELMTEIGNLVNAGASFLVVGGTGTGKTTLTNAITGFYSNSKRIITIEENLEMKPHPKKLIAAPMECVPAKAGSKEEFGVSMRHLVRSSLQMRPDVILIGEVSDGAAYDLCQALNTGHSGGSTVHANDSSDAMSRMISLVSQEEFVKGNAVMNLIAAAFDFIVVVSRLEDGSRKITELVEVGRNLVRQDNGEVTLELHPLWEFNINNKVDESGEIKLEADWKKVGELSEYRKRKHRLNLRKELTWEELLEISTYNVPENERGGLV